jgi:hypothetical protein
MFSVALTQLTSPMILFAISYLGFLLNENITEFYFDHHFILGYCKPFSVLPIRLAQILIGVN